MRPTKPDTPKVRSVKPATGRTTKKSAAKHTGTDTEAFYAAQKEAAADSREYAARRRQR